MDAALIGVLGVLLGVLLDRVWSWIEKGREQKRQRRAVARAILFEIDGLYRYLLRDVRDFLQTLDPHVISLPLIKSIGANPFPVYAGNTARLAELDEDTVEAIVHFYGAMDSYLSTLRDYKTARSRAERLTGNELMNATAEAGTLLGHVKDAAPELIKLTYIVCHRLCTAAQVSFEYPRIAVSREETSIEEITAGLRKPQ